MLFPIFIIQLWFFTVSRIFSYDNCWWIFLWGLFEELIFISFGIGLFLMDFNYKGEIISQITAFMEKQKFSYLIGCIFSLLYHSIALMNGPQFEYMRDLEFLLLDCIIIFYRYSIFSQIYSVIRIEIMGTKHRLKMNLFDLSVNVVTMIHIFVPFH